MVEVLENDSQKWGWLVERLNAFMATGSVLIFVATKKGESQIKFILYTPNFTDSYWYRFVAAEELSDNLNKAGFPG